MMMKNNRKSENGSVFVFILIGVALFAALALVVSQSFRMSNSDTASGTKERNDIAFMELNNFFESLKIRTYQMETSNGISEAQLNFKSDSYLLANDTQNCWNDSITCQTTECRVFSPENPQGIRPVIFDKIASPTPQSSPGRAKNGHLAVGQLVIEGVASPAPELVVMIAGVSPSFCNFYNLKQGITTNFTEASVLEDIGETTGSSVDAPFGGCGTGSNFNTTNTIGDQYADFKGKKTFCSPLDTNAFTPRLKIVYVVKAR